METKQTDLSRQSEETHSIYLEGRSHVRITGVIDVESFHEEEATIRTTAGTLTLGGENMKLGKLDPDAGQVLLDGSAGDDRRLLPGVCGCAAVLHGHCDGAFL